MKRMLFFTAAALCASSALAAGDNFNRSQLGGKWVATDGSLYITNEQLQGSSGALGYDRKSASDAGATVAVYLNGTDVEYGAIALGDIAGGNADIDADIQPVGTVQLQQRRLQFAGQRHHLRGSAFRQFVQPVHMFVRDDHAVP